MANELYYEFKGHDFKKHASMTKNALKKKEEEAKQAKLEEEEGG